MNDPQLNTEEWIKISIKKRKKNMFPAFIHLYTYKKQLQLCIQVISFYINKMFLPFLVTEALKKIKWKQLKGPALKNNFVGLLND